ncbi:MAG: aminoacyl-tRNA hydrolase [Planctomycetes bacterium]|nr:aminoacyl-tRNA hydrolase [Planctomycetota bacterium]
MAQSQAPCLVVGLGNPGGRYENTRHNIGFAVVQRFALRLGDCVRHRVRGSELLEGRLAGRGVLCLRPGLYMNRSGTPVAAVVTERGLDPDQVLAVFDDVDLPPGKLRIRARGSSGGHRGAEDVIRCIGSGFPRLRVGIGRPDANRPVEEWVLEPFQAEEAALVEAAMERAVEAVCCWIKHGVQTAMERFNAPVAETPGDGTPSEDANC